MGYLVSYLPYIGFNGPVFNDTNHVLVVTLNTAAAPADFTFYLSIGG